jgi:hypothetical protein
MRRWLIAGGLVLVLGGLVGLAPAWWVKGHETIVEAAASRLPEEMPAFFRAGGKQLAHFAGDPDRWKNKAATFLKPAEEANHYLDLEDLDGNPLPGTRAKAGDMIRGLKRDPDRVGMLPYAIMEGFDRLSCAFYDYRHDPQSPAVQMKCLVYAGNLAHYTTDAAMPLHTTRDYDGRKNADGTVAQKGIHAKIDGFPEKNKFTPEEVCRGLEAKRPDDLWAHVRGFIAESHKHIDRCYELDAAGAIEKPTDESRAFILDRCRAGAQLTMDVWYAAWLKSATMPPPY